MKKVIWFSMVGVLLTSLIIVRISYFGQGLGMFPISWFFASYTIAVLLSTGFSFLVSEFHKPKLSGKSPTVSIVIPAFNEEKWIRKTVECCLKSDYDNILQVIVVNDGSTDITTEIVQDMLSNDSRLKLINYPDNRGKRKAFMLGVAEAQGELVVLIDSDSFLEPNAIRLLAQSFTNIKTGAVVGHCDVFPYKRNLIEKMQEIEYFDGFKMAKAAEAIFGAVSCLSGCICAYRKSVLLEVKDEWLNQVFLGHTEPIGEDRALTTFILQHGYNTIFQPEAKCRTIVPNTMGKLIKQRIRWKKAWVREEILQGKFYFKKGFIPAIGFYSNMFLGITLPFVVIRFLVIAPLMGNIWSPLCFMSGCLAMGLVMSAYSLWYDGQGSVLANLVAWVFNIIILVWLTPYSALTMTRNNWGTRNIKTLSSRIALEVH